MSLFWCEDIAIPFISETSTILLQNKGELKVFDAPEARQSHQAPLKPSSHSLVSIMSALVPKALVCALKRSVSRRTFTATATPTKTDQFIELESAKSAHNYHPIPKVLNRGDKCHVWDVEGKV